jgi:hypothetical protein
MINNLFYRKKQVVTFHMGRCGSTVLAYMLNDHSKIYWDSEPFSPYMGGKKKNNDKKEFVEHTLEMSRHREISRIYGFETKYLPQQHLSQKCINMDLEHYIAFLEELNFSSFIVLHRKNYLRRVISTLIATQTEIWHSNKTTASPKKVIVPIKSSDTGVLAAPILELFHIMDESFNQLNKLLSSRDTLLLIYEDDILEDPGVAYRKVCKFIGVEDESPEIKLHRTNPFSYEDTVINLEEVRSTLLNSKYSWMLDA